MEKISQILMQIKNLMLEFGFKKIKINDDINYVYGNIYCIPIYIETLGFLIEYAHSLDEAKKNMYGDGDAFPLEMGEEAILAGIEEELRRDVIEEQ